MTHDDASQQTAPETPAPRRRIGRLGYVFGGFVFVFLGGSLLLWFLRKPVAEQALAAWCAERDLDCDANFTELDASGITVSAVKVSSGSAVPAEATEIRADLAWTGWFTPKVTGVTVNGLALRGTLDPSGVKFGGLERLAQSSGGGGEAPPLEIADARILLATPAGQASATLNFSGSLSKNATASIRLDPALLTNPLARAEIREGRLDVRAVDGQVEAELGIGLDQASVAEYSAETFDLLGRAEFNRDAKKPAAIEWSLRAGRIASPDLRATDIRTSGRADFSAMPEATLAGVLDELAAAVFEGNAASLTMSGYTFNSAKFEGELAGGEGDVSGPLIVSSGIVTGPSGSAAGLSLGGELQHRRLGATAFDGKVAVTGAALDDELRAQTGAAFSLPGVLSGHAEALRRALDRALSGFDAEAGIALQVQGEDVTVSAAGDGVLKSTSGMAFRVAPKVGAPWASISKNGVAGEGALSLSGGGAPSVAMDVSAFHLAPGATTLDADAFRLSNWSVGGRTLAANLDGIRLDSRADKLVLAAGGALSFSGEAGGVKLAMTTLTGRLEAAQDAAGWRVQSAGAKCLSVDTAGLTLGAITMAPSELDICPVNGRFLREGPVPGGSATLGRVNLPFAMESGSGALNLQGAAIDWSAASGFALTIRADALGMPLTLGERTLTIDGAEPRIDIRTGKGPAQIAARLGDTVFGGSLIPANVSAGAFTFNGVSAPEGVEGRVSGTGVRITDLNADPIYTPIAAQFSGTIGDNNRLQITGPLTLEADGTPLADASVDINILTLDGTASVVTRPLAFRRGGLQPDMISGRLTGIFTDAVGRVASDARFTIRRGDIDGTADVRVENFGFQTTRLGRVSGVNGRIDFADLMALSTVPAQEFRLSSVNPGIPLSNGRIVFDLREGKTLHLDTVTFPFGGGTLAIAPFDWALDSGIVDQSVAVTADKIDLSQLVEVLKLPDTVATGTVSGTFPILFTDNRVLIKDARLRADDPGGRLSYTGGAVDAAAGQDANASLAFDALRDLRFNVLEIGITGDLAGDMRADLLLAGENINSLPLGNRLTLPPGQAFEFAMGFDLPIGKLIENNLGLVSQQDVIDATIELLNEQKLEEEAAKAGKPPPE
ncbi:MAG: YdbH domain-containing protein [Hyphomonas sp.]